MIQVYPDANRPPRLSSMVLLEEIVDYPISRFTVCDIVDYPISRFTVCDEVGIERNTKLPFCRNGEESDPCTRFFTTVAPYTTAEFGNLPFQLFLIFVGNIQEEKRCIEAILAEFCVEPLQDACPPRCQSQSRLIDYNSQLLPDEVRVMLLGRRYEV